MIELLIVIAIIGVLAAIAIPAYQNHMEKTRRADAISGLTDTAQQLERCYTRNNQYNHDSCPSGTIESPDDFYNIQIEATASSYDLTATAKGIQSDDECSPFTLDELGNRGSDASGTRCWGTE